VLERDALLLERLDEPLDPLADDPGRGGGLVRSRELRFVHQQRRAPALVQQRARLVAARALEAERALVEPLRGVQALHRDRRLHILVCQHGPPPFCLRSSHQTPERRHAPPGRAAPSVLISRISTTCDGAPLRAAASIARPTTSVWVPTPGNCVSRNPI